MKINIEFLEPFDKFDEKFKVDIKGETVRELVDTLIKKYGPEFRKIVLDKKGRYSEDIMILVDGVSIMGELDKKVKDNDEVVFSRTVSGG